MLRYDSGGRVGVGEALVPSVAQRERSAGPEGPSRIPPDRTENRGPVVRTNHRIASMPSRFRPLPSEQQGVRRIGEEPTAGWAGVGTGRR